MTRNSNFWEPFIDLGDMVTDDLPEVVQDRQALDDATAERLYQMSHEITEETRMVRPKGPVETSRSQEDR